MEVVYFLISVIEIILTCFLIFLITKANKKVLECDKIFNEKKEGFLNNFRVAAKILKATAFVSVAYKKMAYFNKYWNKILQIKSMLGLVGIIKNKEQKKKNKIFPILRKVLFFI